MTPEAVTRSLCEFIIIYTHAISYVANVYPRDSYRLVRQYGTTTYQSNHSGVNLWVENAAKSAMQLLYASKYSGTKVILSIVVLEDGKPLERFGVDILEYETKETPASQSQSPQISALDVTEQFRACLVRLYAGEALHEKNYGSDRTLSLFFEGRPDIPEIPKTWFRLQGSEKVNTNRIVPIRSVELNSGAENILVLNTFRQRASSS